MWQTGPYEFLYVTFPFGKTGYLGPWACIQRFLTNSAAGSKDTGRTRRNLPFVTTLYRTDNSLIDGFGGEQEIEASARRESGFPARAWSDPVSTA